MANRIAVVTALVATSYAMYSRFHKREKYTTKSTLEWLKGSPRLPKFAIPKHYDVKLCPDLKACKFDGNLAVTLDITEPTSCLVLNVFDITIKENSVHLCIKGNRQVLEPILIHIEKEDEILVLTFERSIPLGEATLYMEFQGLLNDHMKGFYRSSYVIDGESRNMAVTQFEPADARRCFPCWDEPSFKATFKLRLQVPTDRVVLSNMPVEEEKVDGSIKVVSFMESPKMSTYLVAVVVGKLDYIESVTTGGSIVRVYFEPGKREQGKFALDVATKSLPFYEKYFGTAYPLPKLDMVAIPDFAAGAMENYGLVTYREAALLFDGNNSSAANKQRVAIVVAHELAHQWFGNLVTMEWWTHLWLNEGFATWVSYLAVDHLFPEWNIWTQFIAQTRDALRLDGLVESHPIEVEVGHVREIDEIFDAISYKKGASIIQMLQNYLGPDRFQKGLVSYIKQFEYKNASTEDLWTVLAEESGEPVIELMNSWTKQQGYPVLTVQKKGERLELKQSQYLSSGVHGSGEWIVPVTACFGSYEVIATSLLWGKEGKIDLPSKTPEASKSSNFKELPIFETSKSSAAKWFKLNVGHPGFYRVQYDNELASGLRSAISSGALLATDRFGVLDDTYALCSACKQPLVELLSLMDVFRMETDYTVLSHLIGIAYKVVLVISDAIPSAASDIKRFSASLLQFAAEKLGWDAKPEENHLDTMLRGEILLALVLFGHEDTINEALHRFDVFFTDRKTLLLPPDIRNAAYQAVMQRVTSSDKAYYNLLLKIYKEANLSPERARILTKMASSPDPAVVLEALDFCLSAEVRNQDSVYVLSGISTEGREVAWLWLKENWDLIYKRWGEGFLITHFIGAITSQFSSDMKAEEIGSFFATHGNTSIQRTVNQNIEKVRIAAQWVKHVCRENGLEEFVQELSSRSY